MFTFQLTAVTADGSGSDHSWGDTYQVQAGTYEEARYDVLSREGAPGTQPYAFITQAWRYDGVNWVKLDIDTGELA